MLSLINICFEVLPKCNMLHFKAYKRIKHLWKKVFDSYTYTRVLAKELVCSYINNNITSCPVTQVSSK